jgi:hypothetical protein
MRVHDLALCGALLAIPGGCQAPEELLDGAPTGHVPVVVDSEALAPSEGLANSPPSRSNAGRVSFETPDDWEERPPSNSMRVAEWSVPGDGVCALFSFPGGGTIDANFERWLGQFSQPDGSESAAAARRMTMDVRGVPVEFLQVSGTFHASNSMMNGPGEALPDHALFGAVFPVSPAPYFLKCTGPEASFQAEAEALTAFVASFEFR